MGWDDLLEQEMGTHSTVLAWETPWTVEAGGLQSQRVRHPRVTERAFRSSWK